MGSKKTDNVPIGNFEDIMDTDDMNMTNGLSRIEDLENIIDPSGASYAYEFDITLPNGQTVGKVGDTNAPLRRQKEWAEIYKDYFPVHFSYQGTTNIDDDTFFRDYSIHEYGKQKLGWKQVQRNSFPKGAHYTREAFYGANATNTAEVVKQLRDGIRNGKIAAKLYRKKDDATDIDVSTEPFIPRENQQACIDNIINAYHNGRHHLLCAAHPRFGKSFTALYALDKLGEINFVMVVSAVADAHDEWKDTVSLPNFRNNWIFLDAKRLAEGTGHDIANAINAGKKVVLFCTLQDIEGSEKKAKHAEIYKFAKHNSSLIVDETHNGGRGITFSKKIKQLDTNDVDDDVERELNGKMNDAAINFGFVNQLHLSGTPYRILLTDEFAPEDIVYMSSYSDLLAEKHNWFIEHADEDEHENPYYEFPERYNFVYDINQIPDERMKQFIDEEGIPRLAELFAVVPGENRFVNEDVVRALVKALWGGFTKQGCWGILADKVLNQAVKKFHILMKLPSIAACDAFAALIDDCPEFADYAVILATSNRQRNPSVKSIKQQIKLADESDETAGTITLTCQRLSAAVSVKQWNVAINAADGKSAQDYDQFAQRVCTPFTVDFIDDDGNTIKQVAKPNVFVIDLVPERVLSVSMQAAMAKCAGRGVSSPEDFRAELEKESSNTMTFFISGIESMKQVTAVDVMDMSANYAKSSTIDSSVAKIPFCPSLFAGDTADVLNSLEGEISSAKSFDTKTYDGADDTDVSDKRKKPNDDVAPKSKTESTDSVDTDSDSKEEAKQIQENETKQRAFFARMGYLSVLANRQFDSLTALLTGFAVRKDGEKTVMNVTGLSLSDCFLVAAAIKDSPRVRMAADNLVYVMSRRMNDENMTTDDKLRVLMQSFQKLGSSEIITPSNIADLMISKIDDNRLFDIIGSKSRIVELSSEIGEFAIALVKRFEELGVFVSEARQSICSLPASPLAYELTKKVYELLGLDSDNIYSFTAYDLLDAIKSDDGNVDETAIQRVSAIMKQAKKPCDISLKDKVQEGTDKVNIEAIVGNPPYQTNVKDDSGREQLFSVYNLFIDFSKLTATDSILVTPGRFLFDIGRTPHAWNRNMLVDKHYSVVKYYPNSSDVFASVDIKGGVAITEYNNAVEHNPIGTFVPFDELRNIMSKVINSNNFRSISTIAYASESYKFVEQMHIDYPQIGSMLSRGHRYDLKSNVLGKLTGIVFNCDKPNDGNDYAEIVGRISNQRTSRYIRVDYLKTPNNFKKFKVIIPAANGSGMIGEKISTPLVGTPLVGTPLVGHTQTFMSFGCFDTNGEAEACLKYLKSKFARAMLGTLKVTQTNPITVWRNVPLQDFTSSSDIDWTQPISDIDKQLYQKYNLTDEEINFIETHVKAMD